MSSAQIKAIEDYIRLLDRNAMTHSIRTAVHLGIFSALEKRQHTLEELTDALSLNTEALQRLLNVLCRTELVQNFGDDYALSTVGRMIPAVFRDFGDHHWQYLPGFIKSGQSLPLHEDVPVTEADFRSQWASSEWTQTPAAMDTAKVLGAGTARKALRILDVGCGAAVFGAAIAHHDSECQIYLLDTASDLKRAEKSVSGIGIESRSHFIEADFGSESIADPVHAVAGESGFDLVLMAGVLHRQTLESCETFLKRYRELLKPGGEIAIVDIFPGQEQGDTHRAIFELELSLRTRQCRIHHPDELRKSLEQAGFDEIQYSHLPSPPFVWGLILARRPETGS